MADQRGFSNEFAGQAGFPTSPEMRPSQAGLPPQRQQQAGEHRPNFGGDTYHQPAMGIGPQADGQQYRVKQQSIPPGVASFLRTHSLGVGAQDITNRVASLEEMQRKAMEQMQADPQGAAVNSLARGMSARGPQNPMQLDYSGGGGQQPTPQGQPIPVPSGGGGYQAPPSAAPPVNPYAQPGGGFDPAAEGAGGNAPVTDNGFVGPPAPGGTAAPGAQPVPMGDSQWSGQEAGAGQTATAQQQSQWSGQEAGGGQAPADQYGGFGSGSLEGQIYKLGNDIAGAYGPDGSIHTGMVQAVKDQIVANKDHLHAALSEAGGLLLSGGSPQLAQESLNAAKAMIDMEGKFAAAQANAYAQSAGVLINLLAQSNNKELQDAAQKLQEDIYADNKQYHEEDLIQQQKGNILKMVEAHWARDKDFDQATWEKISKALVGDELVDDAEVDSWFEDKKAVDLAATGATSKYVGQWAKAGGTIPPAVLVLAEKGNMPPPKVSDYKTIEEWQTAAQTWIGGLMYVAEIHGFNEELFAAMQGG